MNNQGKSESGLQSIATRSRVIDQEIFVDIDTSDNENTQNDSKLSIGIVGSMVDSNTLIENKDEHHVVTTTNKKINQKTTPRGHKNSLSLTDNDGISGNDDIEEPPIKLNNKRPRGLSLRQRERDYYRKASYSKRSKS